MCFITSTLKQDQTKAPDITLDKVKMVGGDIQKALAMEEEKIAAMKAMSTSMYDPSHFRTKSGKPIPKGTPHDSYRCYKCGQPGHWIQNCPNVGEREKGAPEPPKFRPSTGIPFSFLKPVNDANAPGAFLTPLGIFARPIVDNEAYTTRKVERAPFLPPLPSQSSAPEEAEGLPEELCCAICSKLAEEAVNTPCCRAVTCDKCIRDKLLEDEQFICPLCKKERVSPLDIEANKFIRKEVMYYRNDQPRPSQQVQKIKAESQVAAGGGSPLSDSGNASPGPPVAAVKTETQAAVSPARHASPHYVSSPRQQQVSSPARDVEQPSSSAAKAAQQPAPDSTTQQPVTSVPAAAPVSQTSTAAPIQPAPSISVHSSATSLPPPVPTSVHYSAPPTTATSAAASLPQAAGVLLGDGSQAAALNALKALLPAHMLAQARVPLSSVPPPTVPRPLAPAPVNNLFSFPPPTMPGGPIAMPYSQPPPNFVPPAVQAPPLSEQEFYRLQELQRRQHGIPPPARSPTPPPRENFKRESRSPSGSPRARHTRRDDPLDSMAQEFLKATKRRPRRSRSPLSVRSASPRRSWTPPSPRRRRSPGRRSTSYSPRRRSLSPRARPPPARRYNSRSRSPPPRKYSRSPPPPRRGTVSPPPARRGRSRSFSPRVSRRRSPSPRRRSPSPRSAKPQKDGRPRSLSPRTTSSPAPRHVGPRTPPPMGGRGPRTPSVSPALHRSPAPPPARFSRSPDRRPRTDNQRSRSDGRRSRSPVVASRSPLSQKRRTRSPLPSSRSPARGRGKASPPRQGSSRSPLPPRRRSRTPPPVRGRSRSPPPRRRSPPLRRSRTPPPMKGGSRSPPPRYHQRGRSRTPPAPRGRSPQPARRYASPPPRRPGHNDSRPPGGRRGNSQPRGRGVGPRRRSQSPRYHQKPFQQRGGGSRGRRLSPQREQRWRSGDPRGQRPPHPHQRSPPPPQRRSWSRSPEPRFPPQDHFRRSPPRFGSRSPPPQGIFNMSPSSYAEWWIRFMQQMAGGGADQGGDPMNAYMQYVRMYQDMQQNPQMGAGFPNLAAGMPGRPRSRSPVRRFTPSPELHARSRAEPSRRADDRVWTPPDHRPEWRQERDREEPERRAWEDRAVDERSRDQGFRQDRRKNDDRQREDRPRDDRHRDEKPRDERVREDTSREDRPKDKVRDEKVPEERPRVDMDREKPEVSTSKNRKVVDDTRKEDRVSAKRKEQLEGDRDKESRKKVLKEAEVDAEPPPKDNATVEAPTEQPSKKAKKEKKKKKEKKAKKQKKDKTKQKVVVTGKKAVDEALSEETEKNNGGSPVKAVKRRAIEEKNPDTPAVKAPRTDDRTPETHDEKAMSTDSEDSDEKAHGNRHNTEGERPSKVNTSDNKMDDSSASKERESSKLVNKEKRSDVADVSKDSKDITAPKKSERPAKEERGVRTKDITLDTKPSRKERVERIDDERNGRKDVSIETKEKVGGRKDTPEKTAVRDRIVAGNRDSPFKPRAVEEVTSSSRTRWSSGDAKGNKKKDSGSRMDVKTAFKKSKDLSNRSGIKIKVKPDALSERPPSDIAAGDAPAEVAASLPEKSKWERQEEEENRPKDGKKSPARVQSTVVPAKSAVNPSSKRVSTKSAVLKSTVSPPMLSVVAPVAKGAGPKSMVSPPAKGLASPPLASVVGAARPKFNRIVSLAGIKSSSKSKEAAAPLPTVERRESTERRSIKDRLGRRVSGEEGDKKKTQSEIKSPEKRRLSSSSRKNSTTSVKVAETAKPAAKPETAKPARTVVDRSFSWADEAAFEPDYEDVMDEEEDVEDGEVKSVGEAPSLPTSEAPVKSGEEESKTKKKKEKKEKKEKKDKKKKKKHKKEKDES